LHWIKTQRPLLRGVAPDFAADVAARVVVKRAALKARDEAELYVLLSQEIEDKDDRKAFIQPASSISRGSPGKP
jgi:hypothetical protein